MDIDSVAMILPEYKKQELLVLRTTILELANERTASILYRTNKLWFW